MAIASFMVMPSSTETAVANGDTRTLNLYHSHTGESIQATFRANGAYDPAVLAKLNYFLRDWRNNDQTHMDPRLFDVVWEVYRTAGATQPIVVVSAYRSPQTNAMLRRRSRGVAQHSQHILGRAMDTTMPGMPMERIREIGMRLQRGGVGWYSSSNFVHLDVGGVRSWPRMSYDQLARLFPDGKTVHLAADGRALSRYAEARAEIASRGEVLSDMPQPGPAGGLFAWLFGKHDSATAAAPANLIAAADRAKAQQDEDEDSPRVADSEPTQHLRGVPEQKGPGGEPATAAESLHGTIDKRAVRFAAVPLPPPRPAQLGSEVRLVFADVPTPPARPVSLTRAASLPADHARAHEDKLASAAAIHTGSQAADAPLARAENLPVAITKGPRDQASTPKQVLSFAADAPLQNSVPAQLNPPPSEPAAKPAAQQTNAEPVRPERPKLRGFSGNPAVAFPAPSILGRTLTGLRRAARLIPGVLSNKPSAEHYASAFGTVPTDLDPDRFTGAAVKPLAFAQGFVRLNQQPPSVREN